MSKVFIFSYHLPTQPLLEMPLYNELVARGVSVALVLLRNDPRLKDDAIKSQLPLPPGLETVAKAKHIGGLMGKDDLLVCRFGYKDVIGDAATPIKASGRKVLMYDVGGVDILFRAVPATYITAKTPWYKQQALIKVGPKYKDIFPIGTIQFDDVFKLQDQKIDKAELMLSYGLDPNKKLAVLIPSNPGEAHMAGIKDDYAKIVKILATQCQGYELMIKGHPTDYALTKTLHYNGKHSWEVFAPQAKVVKADEGYKALAACDVVLNIRSSLALEIPILRKPLLNINSNKYLVNWTKSDNPGVMKNINLEALHKVLNYSDYKSDKAACDEYVKQFTCVGGKNYIRMADLIQKIM